MWIIHDPYNIDKRTRHTHKTFNMKKTTVTWKELENGTRQQKRHDKSPNAQGPNQRG